MKFKPGDLIKIKVGGAEYDTIIDPDGVQRFVQNTLLRFLTNTKVIDLNYLALVYQSGNGSPFSQRDYAEFNMMLGYSVCGFADLSFFDDMEIENPVWDESSSFEVLEIEKPILEDMPNEMEASMGSSDDFEFRRNKKR